MKKMLLKYRSLSPLDKTLSVSILTMSFGVVISFAKIVMGLLSDPIVSIAGLFGVALFLAKLECVLGLKKEGKSFKYRSGMVAFFLFVGGLIYVIYMGKGLFFPYAAEPYSKWKGISIATLGFLEMGMALAGLRKVKKLRSGHFLRDLKVINFCSALTAIMTAQVAILSFTEGGGWEADCYTGIAIGIVTVLLAVYIFFAPKLSLIGREVNSFRLLNRGANRLVDLGNSHFDIYVCRSYIYGDCVYEGVVDGEVIKGKIVKSPGFWKKTHPLIKTILLILSEILVFVWAIGYAVYFIRSSNLPRQLEKKMRRNGFEAILES